MNAALRNICFIMKFSQRRVHGYSIDHGNVESIAVSHPGRNEKDKYVALSESARCPRDACAFATWQSRPFRRARSTAVVRSSGSATHRAEPWV